ncbi:glycosyltransferase family 2 protein [Bacillus mobilis]|uniref:glycosyltransferase family 2 protein n=1 Tax=Bacillus mobilis TaxID=2026190 RepID=UPI003D055A89
MSQLSIIVPIYNAEKKLDKCIKSILKQTFKDFELILVNDGSSDNSLNICRKYEKQDNRIVVIDKENEGSILTRKKGIEASNANYIMFVDADDWIDKKMAEELYHQSMENNADITVCNMYKVLGNSMLIKKKNKSRYFSGNKIYDKSEIKREIVVAYFWGHPFPPSLCAKLYRKELIENSGKYLDRISFLGEDLFYNLEIFIKANKVKIIDKPLYYYRHGGFTSKYMPHLFNDMVNGYQIQKEVIDEFYVDTKQIEYNGISIMLLNTFKTCLYNLFSSNLTASEIVQQIQLYVSNDNVIECLNNEGSLKYFSEEYLNAIKNKNIKYLYELGKQMYRKKKIKIFYRNFISKISII